jgi:curved DNA-binding protein CbpA
MSRSGQNPGREVDAASAEPGQVSLPAELAKLIDPSLEIAVELQGRLLLLEQRLDAPYHEVLGVPADAERPVLKKAFFGLSRDYHPDRYFRRNIGGYEARVDRVYKKIVEAYELLSDPTARSEIERSLAAAAGLAPSAAPDSQPTQTPGSQPPQAEAADETAAPSAPRRRRVPLRPRSHGFSLHNRVQRERKAKAKRLFEAGMAAFAREEWIDAAGSVRLAIAFDPWNEAFKDRFVDVQRKAHEVLSERHLKEAENAAEMRDYPAAARAYEEAIQYRAHDPRLLFNAAEVVSSTGGDLHRAKEWAQSAVEIEPENSDYHRLLGQVFRMAGLDANAKREIETALQINPENELARSELKALGGGGRFRAPRWLGGKR